MKKKLGLAIAASALAATGVIGAAGSQSASAGCGVSITGDNDESQTVTVNWALSQVKVGAWGVPATWATLGNSSSNVGADSGTDSDEVTRAFTLGLGCNFDRRYRLYVSDGANSWYEYFPSSTGWTQSTSPFIELDR
jgi:hypothetical protein